LDAALRLAEKDLVKTYGFPTYIDNDGNLMRAEFAVVGLGKLGGREIHYGSDLDLIFLYSRNGQTEGRKIISNREFYARQAQKFISYLSVYTMAGFAYRIDTQLRPSGNKGALVSSFDAYADYQRNKAAPWEKQALLKARYITGEDAFGEKLAEQFLKFIYSTEFPPDLNQEMHRLRLRMEKEIAHETPRRFHYKHGPGGLTDIEFAVQYIQLKMGKIFESIVIRNTLEAIERMGERTILKKDEYEVLKTGYLFYRLLETRMEVMFDLKEGYLDPESHLLENLAEAMGEHSQQALLDKFQGIRNDVRKTYLRILQQW
jgi:glutamate-ammonia-ligase adenylyltransferase